jgi:methylthioribose-1-phosphate isomerase
MRTIWPSQDGAVTIIDQTRLPHELATVGLRTLEEAAHAIASMQVRGAPLIGAAAAYGLALAMREDPSDEGVLAAARRLARTRPTAVNLAWALGRMQRALLAQAPCERASSAWRLAQEIAEEDVTVNTAIGRHGLALIRAAQRDHGRPVQILTHCNAGWLAAVDAGTATAPIYAAHDEGLALHVWVDETRPRNQGASLTAWELGMHGVAHTVIADNTGGHLMQHAMVDLVIVGADRITASGDVANKIGTYLKALAARDNGVPFYVALPSSTIDWTLRDGIREIPIEQRDPREVTHVQGRTAGGEIVSVQVTPDGSGAANYGFDVTPARLITGLITERGVCAASPEGLSALFPDRSGALTARSAPAPAG